MEKKVQVNKDDDLQKNKVAIKEILSAEISSRYYYQKGRIKTLLNSDKEVLKAIDILSDKEAYDSILSANDK